MNPMLAAFFLSLACGASRQEFCEGFKAGLKAGWCEGHPAWAACAPAPVSCPNHEGTFQDGHDAGYDEGMRQHHCGHAPCAEGEGR